MPGRSGDRSTLTQREWGFLRRRIGQLLWVFIKPGTVESSLFHRVMNVTVHAGRYTFKITADKFRIGQVGAGVILGTLCSKRTFYRARQWLADRNVVAYLNNEYLINLPGMIAALDDLGKRYNPEWWETLDDLSRKLEEDYGGLEAWKPTPAIPRETGMTLLEEQLEEARQKSSQARERKRLQRNTAPILKRNMVLPVLEDRCQEFGVPYAELGPEGRVRKNVRDWLNLCLRNSWDPRERLRLIARYWSGFRANRIVKPDGKFLVLNEAVNFFEYFNNKQLVDGFLVANLAMLEAEDAEYAEAEWKPM